MIVNRSARHCYVGTLYRSMYCYANSLYILVNFLIQLSPIIHASLEDQLLLFFSHIDIQFIHFQDVFTFIHLFLIQLFIPYIFLLSTIRLLYFSSWHPFLFRLVLVIQISFFLLLSPNFDLTWVIIMFQIFTFAIHCSLYNFSFLDFSYSILSAFSHLALSINFCFFSSFQFQLFFTLFFSLLCSLSQFLFQLIFKYRSKEVNSLVHFHIDF